jgi:opacity protein-like surface antigen
MRKLALLCALACAPAAWGQYLEAWFIGGQTYYKNAGLGTLAVLGGSKNDIRLEDGFRWGFRLNFNGDSYFGHEFNFAVARAQFAVNSTSSGVTATSRQSMNSYTYGYNFVAYANHEGNRFRPFATGGVGAVNYVFPGTSLYSGGSDVKFGFNYGGGLKIRVKGPIGLRFDARQYTNPKPFQNARFGITAPAGGWMRMNELSAGIGFLF